MSNNVLGAHAEATACAQGPSQGTDNHFYLGRVDVLRFGDAAARSPEDAKRPRLVEDHAELVLLFQLDLKT